MKNLIAALAAAGSIALGVVYSISTGHAATICKGLDQPKCETTEVYQGIKACKWMPESKRASGNNVKAHCRGSSAKVPDGAVLISAPKQ